MCFTQEQNCMAKDIFLSPIGYLCIEADKQGVTRLFPLNDTSVVESYFVAAECAGKVCNHAVIAETKDWLQQYFSGHAPTWNPSLHLIGTEFQRKVWNLLLQIPYGSTTTYGRIAKQISPSMSAQAIGQAVGKNPIAIVVPCHRVVQSNGSLGGYAFGPEMKKSLLRLENVTKY